MIAGLTARMHEHRPDALVAIGGGSTMDMAKAARLEFGQGEPFERFTRFEVAVTEPALPLVTVPTTSGTGSEVSGGAVVTVGTRKRGAAHPLMRAQHALVDPLLTLDLPHRAHPRLRRGRSRSGHRRGDRAQREPRFGRTGTGGVPVSGRRAAGRGGRRPRPGGTRPDQPRQPDGGTVDEPLRLRAPTTPWDMRWEDWLTCPTGSRLACSWRRRSTPTGGCVRRGSSGWPTPSASRPAAAADGARAVSAVRRILAEVEFPTCGSLELGPRVDRRDGAGCAGRLLPQCRSAGLERGGCESRVRCGMGVDQTMSTPGLRFHDLRRLH